VFEGAADPNANITTTTTTTTTPKPGPVTLTNPPGGMVVGDGSSNSGGSSNTGGGTVNSGSGNGDSPVIISNTAQSVTVSMTFPVNYATYVEGRKPEFLAEVRPQLAAYIGISESRITNLEATAGSIVLTFDILQASSSGEVTLQAAIAKTQNLVTSSKMSLSVTDNSGNKGNILADKGSFTYSTVTPTPAVTIAQVAGLSTAAIVGIVVGVVVFIVIIVVIVVVLYKYKNSPKEIDDVENFQVSSSWSHESIGTRGTRGSVPGAPSDKQLYKDNKFASPSVVTTSQVNPNLSTSPRNANAGKIKVGPAVDNVPPGAPAPSQNKGGKAKPTKVAIRPGSNTERPGSNTSARNTKAAVRPGSNTRRPGSNTSARNTTATALGGGGSDGMPMP